MDPSIPTPVDPITQGPASVYETGEWYPATVILISKQLEFLEDGVTTRERAAVTVQYDTTLGLGHFEQNPNGGVVVATKRDDGVWRSVGNDEVVILPGHKLRVSG